MANIQQDFLNYFSQTPQGQTMNWAGGKLARGADNTATYTGPQGRQVTFNANQNLADIAKQHENIASTWMNDYGFNAKAPQTGLIGAEQALTAGRDAAASRLDPYAQAGQQAINPLTALTGALGQEAFDQAYTDSPYMKFLQQQGEQAVTRNAAALGGLGGGNVMKELTRFGQGLSGQGLQQQINNLQGLSQLGASAAGQQGGYDFNTGLNLAQGRTGAGNQLSALAALEGQNIAQQIGTTGGNLANLLAGIGGQQGGLQTDLSGLLANIATGSASNVSGLNPIPGISRDDGIGDDGRAALGTAMMAMMGMSDVRLKENIKPLGAVNCIKLYSWDWNKEGKAIAKDQPTVGVIAQELAQTHPEAVFKGDDGYLRVNYGGLF